MKKRLLFLIAFFAMSMFIVGCNDSGDSAPTALINGLVVDTTGAPLEDVTITVGSVTVNSEADGTYELTVTPGANLRVSADKAGYVIPFKLVTVLSGQTVPVNFTLSAIGISDDLTGMSTSVSVVTDPRAGGFGATVTLPAGSIVDGSGAPVDDATVEVTTSLPGDLNFGDTFPGFFIGDNAGVTSAIESFGFVTIDITCGGEECNLGAGQTADIAIPVAAGADPGTATIELWSLNEVTGIWEYEGLAYRDASGSPVVYRATVSHFSTYNLDRPIENAIPFNILVTNEAGAPVANAQVVIDSTNEAGGGQWQGRGLTDANGVMRFEQVPPGSVAVRVTNGSQVGTGYGYSIVDGEGEMEITLYTAVSRTFTVVYLIDGVETPAAGITAGVFSEGPSGHSSASGTTNSSGVVTLNMRSGLDFYMYNADITVDGVTYSLFESVESLDGIPAKWVLVESASQS